MPEGLDALCLAELAQGAPGWLVHIARDEGRMAALAEGIKDIQVTVESDIEVILYHRISPRVKEQLAAAPAETAYTHVSVEEVGM